MSKADNALQTLENQRDVVAGQLRVLDEAIALIRGEVGEKPEPSRRRRPRSRGSQSGQRRRRRNNKVRLSHDPAPMLEMLRNADKPMTAREMGEKLGVSPSTVERAARGRDDVVVEQQGRTRRYSFAAQPAGVS